MGIRRTRRIRRLVVPGGHHIGAGHGLLAAQPIPFQARQAALGRVVCEAALAKSGGFFIGIRRMRRINGGVLSFLNNGAADPYLAWIVFNGFKLERRIRLDNILQKG